MPSDPRQTAPWIRYAVAVGATLVALGVRLALQPILGERMPLFVFLLSAMGSAFFGGLGPGLVATVLGAAAAATFVMEPGQALALAGADHWLHLGVFVLLGALQSLAIGELHRTRAHVADVLSSITESYFAVGRDWRLTEMNDAAARYCGMQRAAALGKTLWELFPRATDTYVARRLREAMASRAPQQFETASEAFPGRWVEAHVRPVREGLRVFFRDITERKVAEKALRDSERVHRTIGESIDYGVWICDREGRNVYASDSFLRLIGMSQQQCSDFGWSTALHRDDAERTIAAWQECVRTGGTWDMEQRFRGADGGWHTVLSRGAPVRDEEGAILWWVGINLDIGGLKAAEMAARESEARFRALADSAPVLIWMSGANKEGVFFNKTWLEFTGRPLEEQLGNGWLRGVHPEDHERLAECAAGFADRRPFTIQFRLRRADGEWRWVQDTGVPRFTADGTFAGFVGSCLDVTDRIRAEEALAGKVAELARSNAELEDFAYLISHDLKEPLRGIHNYSEFLLEDHRSALAPDAVARLETIGRLSQRLAAQLDSLLEYARVGHSRLAPAAVDMREVVHDVLESLAPSIEEQRVAVRVPETLPVVHCDRARIVEVLRNLVQNACKYNDKPEKWVEIGVRCGGPVRSGSGATHADTDTHTDPHTDPHTGNVRGPWLCWVRDNGIGIPEKHLQTVFRMFKRLHGRNEFGGGTGSGLALAQRIVERHGGRIWAESRPGEGATFWFTLPAAPAGGGQDATPGAADVAAAAGAHVEGATATVNAIAMAPVPAPAPAISNGAAGG